MEKRLISTPNGSALKEKNLLSVCFLQRAICSSREESYKYLLI